MTTLEKTILAFLFGYVVCSMFGCDNLECCQAAFVSALVPLWLGKWPYCIEFRKRG